MKMVKSLLLGSAAGLVAMTGAQAADLPVKAKAVQYVKICSLYGAGFYYIPGTDTCIKLGGFVRYENNWQANGSFAVRMNGTTGTFTRTSNDVVTRARGVITTDARSQTEYGTLRSYTAFGEQWTTGDATTAGSGAVTNMYRLFIQLGGFTAGRTASFFDLWDTPKYSNTTNVIASDTGGTGQNLIAYTFSFGNGLSASLSFEDPTMRRAGVANAAVATTFGSTGLVTGSYAGANWPDVVTNLRVDQAWGAAQIMGAIHAVTATYYGATQLETNGHPNDEVGWAIGGGLNLNVPWAQGDTFSVQAAYTQGALAYVAQGLAGGSALGNGLAVFNGQNVALGYATDGVYGPTGSIELTSAWSVYAGIQHYWTPNLRTSLYGGYLALMYNANATALICGDLPGAHTGACNADWQMFQIGSRTVFNPVANLDLSVDILYNRYQTAGLGSTVVLAPGNSKPTQAYTLTDEGVWQAMFRVQRNFYP